MLRSIFLISLVFLNVCDGEETGRKPKCGVYLAPSSIPGSGLGMFAGDKDYKKGETVTLGDVLIPISEYDWNNQGGPFESAKFLWDEYTWSCGDFPPMVDEADDEDRIKAASPGVGSAANSYLTLANLENTRIKIGRAVGPESPGLGASTLYWGRDSYASKDIPAGGELFVSYGSGYFMVRPNVYGYLPLPETYRATDQQINKYLAMKSRVTQQSRKSLGAEVWKDYYDTVRSFGSIWEYSRVLNGLPEEEAKLQTIMNEGGSSQQHYNRSIVDVAWLEQNGQCMDNIKVGNSTNPDAGRGAFANRFIPKGGLVAPAPLIHIRDYNALKIFLPKDHDRNPSKVVPDRDGPVTFQLLLNYCFGHEKSTLLLCPYGLLTAFINHSHDAPNARIQWSETMRHPEWREKPLKDWTDEHHTGLQIDFVALRDIEEDEEVFIDYGEAWEAAWQEHVKKFVPRKNYVPSFVLNEMMNIDYRTIDDVEYEVDGVVLRCRGWYVQQYTNVTFDRNCRILKKLGNDRYRAQLIEVEYNDKERYMDIQLGAILWNVPSDAFYFSDLPYSRDHYDLQSFRHAMLIPDDMFPTVWETTN